MIARKSMGLPLHIWRARRRLACHYFELGLIDLETLDANVQAEPWWVRLALWIEGA